MKNLDAESFMTRDEVMNLLKCNGVTLWRYTKSGRLPHYRAGRRMLFKASEILEAIRIK